MMFVMGGRNFECSAVDDKRVKLESYLRSLLEIPEVQRSLELKTFLGTNPGRVLHDVPDVNAATAAAPRASNVSEPPAVDAGKEMQRRLGVSEGSEQGGSLAGGSSAASRSDKICSICCSAPGRIWVSTYRSFLRPVHIYAGDGDCTA